MVSPALYSEPFTGAVIVAVGGRFDVTVSLAALLVAEPNEFVTTHLNNAPLSVPWTFGNEYVADMAPEMSTLLRCH
jgi:hypothetical protein